MALSLSLRLFYSPQPRIARFYTLLSGEEDAFRISLCSLSNRYAVSSSDQSHLTESRPILVSSILPSVILSLTPLSALVIY